MEYLIQDKTLTDIADAIRQKTGKADKLAPNNMPQEIAGISTQDTDPNPVAVESDVNFYDYNGICRFSYTIAQAQALTQLPGGLTHEGLIFQGWNWELADVKSLTHPADIGALYITDTGDTRLFIRFNGILRKDLSLHFQQTVSNGVVINWGDESETETLDGTGVVSATHSYSQQGEYVITLTPDNECQITLGAGKAAQCIVGNTDNSGKVYTSMLKEVQIGRDVTNLSISCFEGCICLEKISMTNAITTIGNNCFESCAALKIGIIPPEINNVPVGMYKACSEIKAIALPNASTKLSNNAFATDFCLERIIVPGTVTNLGTGALQSCAGLKKIYFLSATPPVLAASSSLSGLADDCVIYVPSGALSDYQLAQYWSDYAGLMVET